MRQREWYGLRRVYSYSAKSELTFLISFRNDIGFIAPPAFLSLYCPSPSPSSPFQLISFPDIPLYFRIV